MKPLVIFDRDSDFKQPLQSCLKSYSIFNRKGTAGGAITNAKPYAAKFNVLKIRSQETYERWDIDLSQYQLVNLSVKVDSHQFTQAMTSLIDPGSSF